MTKRTKGMSPFRLDMDPDDALERFIRTKPSEVDALIKRGKKKKPPGSKERHPPGGSDQSETIVSLRRRRMRKWNTGR